MSLGCENFVGEFSILLVHCSVSPCLKWVLSTQWLSLSINVQVLLSVITQLFKVIHSVPYALPSLIFTRQWERGYHLHFTKTRLRFEKASDGPDHSANKPKAQAWSLHMTGALLTWIKPSPLDHASSSTFGFPHLFGSRACKKLWPEAEQVGVRLRWEGREAASLHETGNQETTPPKTLCNLFVFWKMAGSGQIVRDSPGVQSCHLLRRLVSFQDIHLEAEERGTGESSGKPSECPVDRWGWQCPTSTLLPLSPG